MDKRAKGVIQGIVQGVGFRPFVYQVARRCGLGGYVSNTSQGVDVEVEGREEDIRRFFEDIRRSCPPLARIRSIAWEEISPKHEKAFVIELSRGGKERSALIPPDVCICDDCLVELQDPGDRRFRYPFINCTNCGPRYTIIMDIPYDRAATTMKTFSMCPACRKEYDDPDNRRFHAQPNACWDCGPRVALTDAEGRPVPCADPVQEGISLLATGHILAIKGLGGYHLVVDAANPRAVGRLRKRKHREEKPLALMMKDLETVRGIARVSEAEARILESPQRPIVVLGKRRTHGLSPGVAPRNKDFGVMLPYTPLHYLLMDGPFRALVMTSGNMTEEPITVDNRHALERLGGIADFFLTHDRDIHLRSDDSVVRLVGGIPRQIRRSRGYVPVPVFLSEDLKDMPSVLAVGGELKNTVCLTKENRAFLSQHVGDMENLETLEFFHLTVAHMRRILEIRPEVMACDLHPDYLSSQYAKEQSELPVMAVQHHHAHIVSCLAEHGVEGPAIGVALDGTGFGADGHIWGGEVLLADRTSFVRAAHLDYIPLPGGDAAARFPWRTALAYLRRAYGDALFELPIPFVRALDSREARLVLQMIRQGVNSPLTSSCGRLFDAVSALLGLRYRIAYEGQAAIELDMRQDRRASGTYPWAVSSADGCRVMLTSDIIRGAVEDLAKGVPKGAISRRFHNAVIGMLVETASDIGQETDIRTVALSGGSFQNVTLLTEMTRRLSEKGFTVLSHARVPTNDGCIALGQAVCAGMRFAGREGAWDKDGPRRFL